MNYDFKETGKKELFKKLEKLNESRRNCIDKIENTEPLWAFFGFMVLFIIVSFFYNSSLQYIFLGAAGLMACGLFYCIRDIEKMKKRRMVIDDEIQRTTELLDGLKND